jgi:hypothetical protein
VKSTHQEQFLFTAIPLSTAHHFPSLRGHVAKPADAPQNRAGKFVCPAYYRKLVKDMSHKPDAPKSSRFPAPDPPPRPLCAHSAALPRAVKGPSEDVSAARKSSRTHRT